MQSVTAIFDIGKTNKKFFLFDDDLKELSHDYKKFTLIKDDDGFECDDLDAITQWIKETIANVMKVGAYRLKAINFSTYGATLVHLDENGKPVTPLYNYLKPFPEEIQEKFFETYGNESHDLISASPSLGMLNSGLQLYWLKYEKPEVFREIHHTLHFPQYLSYLFTGEMVSEPTSIGCHTKLWDFEKNGYDKWLRDEGVEKLFAPIVPTTHSTYVTIDGTEVKVGVGIHDSSSALASYLLNTNDPFILVSTGTWSVTLNPFTKDILTIDELKRDCLSYLDINGNPVKSSRLFLGNELDTNLKNLNEHFGKDRLYYKSVQLDTAFMAQLRAGALIDTFFSTAIDNKALLQDVFPGRSKWDITIYHSFEEAYHHLIWGLAQLQVAAIRLVEGSSRIKRIFVDGGFIDNEIFIELLKFYLPEYSLEVSQMPLGSAYGAALIMK